MADIPPICSLGDTGDQYLITHAGVGRTFQGVMVATELDRSRQNTIREYLLEQQEASQSESLSVNQWFKVIESRFDQDTESRLLLNLIIGISFMRDRGRGLVEFEDKLSLDFIWSHIYAAVVQTRVPFKPSRSSVGFVFVPLCSLVEDKTIDELWRLHVWLPDGRRGNPALCIHRHHVFGQSWILAGNGTDQRWKVDVGANVEEATHAEYRVSWDDGNSSGPGYKTHQVSSTVTNTRKYVVATPLGSEEVLRRGMTYCIHPNEWHSSQVAEKDSLATLFVFDANRGMNTDAPILGPKKDTSFTTSKSPPDITVQHLVKLVEAARSQEDDSGKAPPEQEQ